MHTAVVFAQVLTYLSQRVLPPKFNSNINPKKRCSLYSEPCLWLKVVQVKQSGLFRVTRTLFLGRDIADKFFRCDFSVCEHNKLNHSLPLYRNIGHIKSTTTCMAIYQEMFLLFWWPFKTVVKWEAPWRGWWWQFRVFAAAGPPQAVQFHNRLSCALLSFQRAAVYVSTHSLGLGSLLLLLPVCLVHWTCARSVSHFTAAATLLFNPGPCGGHGHRFQTQHTGVNGTTNRPRCRATNHTECARFGRSRQAAVLNAVSGVRPQEALLTAGIKTVFATRGYSSSNRLHRDARWLGSFPHSSRATGDGGAPCCHNSGSTSGCWYFLVAKGGSSSGFN